MDVELMRWEDDGGFVPPADPDESRFGPSPMRVYWPWYDLYRRLQNRFWRLF